MRKGDLVVGVEGDYYMGTVTIKGRDYKGPLPVHHRLYNRVVASCRLARRSTSIGETFVTLGSLL
eukprot:206688-Pyramimonas_sp.AAC.1